MGRLLIIMLGAFVAQTAEYLPIGLLPQIGADLSVSESAVGTLVTGYAWLAAASAVPLTLATQRLDRRWLFLGLLAIVSAANVLAALSPTYSLLASMRVITALTHGVFWSILASFAIRAAPQVAKGRALAWAFGGISLAIVAGVPAATAIGQFAGWRAAFGVFAAVGLVVTIAGIRWLPPTPAEASPGEGGSVKGNQLLYVAATVTALIVAAHFCGYTYIVPLLAHVALVPQANVPLLLFVFGCAGAAGTALAGWTRLRPAALARIAALGIVGSQALMSLVAASTPLAWLEMVMWGSSVSMLIIGLQGWVLDLAPDNPDAASALYVAAFNFGIGAGAMIGGVALQAATERAVLWVGIAIGALACLVQAVLPSKVRFPTTQTPVAGS